MASLDFVGSYSCSLDNKNRVNIPANIRKVLTPEAQDTIVITRGIEGDNLIAYPLDVWARISRGLRSLNPFDSEFNDFIRIFAGNAYNAKFDSQGRIMLPEYILKIGGIKKDLLIIGSLNKFEIWNPEIFDEFQNKRKINYQKLATRIPQNILLGEEG